MRAGVSPAHYLFDAWPTLLDAGVAVLALPSLVRATVLGSTDMPGLSLPRPSTTTRSRGTRPLSTTQSLPTRELAAICRGWTLPSADTTYTDLSPCSSWTAR